MARDMQMFCLDCYGQKPPFASFLPGIAGVKGIPIWCYYVNRGQGVVSFGVDNKDHAIMEFLSAHRAYASVRRTGFRTFLRRDGRFVEPFQCAEAGRMTIGMNTLRLEENDRENGLQTKVEYFVLPEERLGALVRRVQITNTSSERCRLEVLDGMPELVPYGVGDGSLKNMLQTTKAWMQVEHVAERTPYYRVRVSLGDTAQVGEVAGGNFVLGFDESGNLLPVVADMSAIFSYDTSLERPLTFQEEGLAGVLSREQNTSNLLPGAFFALERELPPGESLSFTEVIGKYFTDYATILQTAQTLKDAGYRCFASDSEMSFFSSDEPWVIDGKLNVSQGRLAYMDMVVDLYQKDLTAYCATWSTPWYQAMGGPVPILTAEDNVWDESFAANTADSPTVEVFSFALPTWGTLTLRDHVGELSGKWGVCAGPHPGFSGGSFLGISELSKQKDLAWDFIKFCVFNEETIDWWIEASEGDVVSLLSAQEKHKEDENPLYGNQKLYAFWSEQAKLINPSVVTSYDTAIGDAWGAAIGKVKTGEATKEAAINEFYDKIASTYPDLTIER